MTVHQLRSEHICLIVATDGVWEVRFRIEGGAACLHHAVFPHAPAHLKKLPCPTPPQVLSPSEATKLVCDLMAQGCTAEEAAAKLCRESVQLATCVRNAGSADNTTAAVLVFPEL